MTKESILKRKRTDIVMSEILFLAFEGDTLWVYFFKSEVNAHILSLFQMHHLPVLTAVYLSLKNDNSIAERAL